MGIYWARSNHDHDFRGARSIITDEGVDITQGTMQISYSRYEVRKLSGSGNAVLNWPESRTVVTNKPTSH